MGGLDVPSPVGHVEHAHVVDDQQREGEHAQGVNVMAAIRVHPGPLSVDAATFGLHERVSQPKGMTCAAPGTNGGSEGRAKSLESPAEGEMNPQRYLAHRRYYEVAFWLLVF